MPFYKRYEAVKILEDLFEKNKLFEKEYKRIVFEALTEPSFFRKEDSTEISFKFPFSLFGPHLIKASRMFITRTFRDVMCKKFPDFDVGYSYSHGNSYFFIELHGENVESLRSHVKYFIVDALKKRNELIKGVLNEGYVPDFEMGILIHLYDLEHFPRSLSVYGCLDRYKTQCFLYQFLL
jgi:hypothetical protein